MVEFLGTELLPHTLPSIDVVRPAPFRQGPDQRPWRPGYYCRVGIITFASGSSACHSSLGLPAPSGRFSVTLRTAAASRFRPPPTLTTCYSPAWNALPPRALIGSSCAKRTSPAKNGRSWCVSPCGEFLESARRHGCL